MHDDFATRNPGLPRPTVAAAAPWVYMFSSRTQRTACSRIRSRCPGSLRHTGCLHSRTGQPRSSRGACPAAERHVACRCDNALCEGQDAYRRGVPKGLIPESRCVCRLFEHSPYSLHVDMNRYRQPVAGRSADTDVGTPKYTQCPDSRHSCEKRNNTSEVLDGRYMTTKGGSKVLAHALQTTKNANSLVSIIQLDSRGLICNMAICRYRQRPARY